MARPIPRLDPVTTAIFPCRLTALSFSLLSCLAIGGGPVRPNDGKETLTMARPKPVIGSNHEQGTFRPGDRATSDPGGVIGNRTG